MVAHARHNYHDYLQSFIIDAGSFFIPVIIMPKCCDAFPEITNPLEVVAHIPDRGTATERSRVT
jgi:hypothetical protein